MINAGFALFEAPVSRLSARGAERLAHVLGTLMATFSRRRRVRFADANIRIALPELDAAERRGLVRRSFDHLVLVVLDTMRARHWDADDLRERVEIEGREHFDAARARGKGLVFVSAHLGNFELMIRRFAIEDERILIIGRRQTNDVFNERISASRTELGNVRLVEPQNAGIAFYRAIRKGDIVGALVDQRVRRRLGLFIPFFGVRCPTPHMLAALAVKCDSPIVCATMARIGPDRHRIEISPPLEFERSGDAPTDVMVAAEACNRAIESRIRARPEQWLWATRRFRHSPDLPVDPYEPGAPRDFPLPAERKDAVPS